MNVEAKKQLFIDFEFTMAENKMNPEGFFQEIIEAGVVKVERGKIKETFSTFVKPRFFPKLTERCKRFLEITQEQVDNGLSFSELVHLLRKLSFGEETMIVTWGNMDMKVLRHNCKEHGLPFPIAGTEIDLSMEYKKFFGDRNQTGLWKAVEEYGKKGIGKHHRALDDALTTFNIFKLIEKDKQYLLKPKPLTIGERIDLTKLWQKQAT